jgi:hypothetical protein
MKYNEALDEVVKQGAIRVVELSKGWHIVYRVHAGQLQARSLIKTKVADQAGGAPASWKSAAYMSGAQSQRSEDGWFPVDNAHADIQPIELDAAKENPGYWQGSTRRCETCKKFKPESAFERDMSAEAGRRTWECNRCADERQAEVAGNKPERRGDVMKRTTHASEPPVEGEV